MLAAALALSLGGLCLGPVLEQWARGRARAMVALDAATLALVPGVILLRLLPHLVEDVGISALIGLALGYVALQVAEATSHRGAMTVGLVFVLPTLALHSFFDGAALGVALGHAGLDADRAVLVSALLVHRIPEGLFLASLMAGTARLRWGIAAIAAATILGGLVGNELLDHHSGESLHLVVAVGLGVMLRLVIHRHDLELAPDPALQWTGGVTFVLCLGLVLGFLGPELLWRAASPHELSIGEALVPLFLEPSLVLLVLLVLAEVLARVVPAPEAAERPADPWICSAVLGAWLLGPWLAAVSALSPLARRIWGRSAPGNGWRSLFALPRARDVLPAYCVWGVLTAVAEAALPAGAFAGNAALVILLASVVGGWGALGIGAPLLATLLVHKGAPLEAVLGLLIAASTRDALPAHRLGVRVVAAGVAAGAGLVLALIFERCAIPALHALGWHVHLTAAWIAACVIGAWILADLSRVGPRWWFRLGERPPQE